MNSGRKREERTEMIGRFGLVFCLICSMDLLVVVTVDEKRGGERNKTSVDKN